MLFYMFAYVGVCVCILFDVLTLCHTMASLMFVSFFLKVCFVWYKNYHAPFLSDFSSVKYLYYPLALSLCASLKLKCVSCRQHTVGSYFHKHLCPFVGAPTLAAFRLGVDVWAPTPAVWVMPSGCCLSPLIPLPPVSDFCKLVALHRGIVSPFYVSCIYSRFLLWLPWSLQ